MSSPSGSGPGTGGSFHHRGSGTGREIGTLSSLELPRAIAVATVPSSPNSNGGPPSYENQERTEVGKIALTKEDIGWFTLKRTGPLIRISDQAFFPLSHRQKIGSQKDSGEFFNQKEKEGSLKVKRVRPTCCPLQISSFESDLHEAKASLPYSIKDRSGRNMLFFFIGLPCFSSGKIR
ncbi:hypothetical protein HYC85_021084 [Camellia sinensis]|uniref:Uncharacterized protein n=1 Tax=Camellia sinensis TaxID=4442 RepID=A0A7J7GHE0_CAMSI|nr:hypothetical protein HYC85_021084 [Camellia sinensis]